MTSTKRCLPAILASIVLLQPLRTTCLVSGNTPSLNQRNHEAFIPNSLSARTQQASIPMATRPLRGGGSRKAASQVDDGDRVKKAQGALDSMKLTYRWCFASVLADILITLVDRSAFQEPFTWLVAVDIVDSLNLVFFGYGLWTVTNLYGENLISKTRMTHESVFDLCTTMARLWRTTAWSILGVSMSLAASNWQQAGLSNTAGPTTLIAPAGLAVVAAVVAIVLRKLAAQDAADAVMTEGKKKNKAETSPETEKARTAGFRVTRNMSLCMGSFAIMGSMRFVAWVLTPAAVVARVFTVFDFITPFAIAGLMRALCGSFLRAIVAVTGELGSDSDSIDFSIYDDLYEAQTGFYSKVGDTLRSATIFSLLPYAFALIKPYIMFAAVKIVPSLGEL